jgi:hypothetical protein
MYQKGKTSFSKITVIFLVLTLLLPSTGEAKPSSQETTPEAVAAPGDHLVTQLYYNLMSPNILRTTERVEIGFSYSTIGPTEVLIYIRPYTDGVPTPGYSAHPSPLYPVSATGKGSGWFTINTGTAVVDQIRITMWNNDLTVMLFETFLPVHYLFTNAANVVSGLYLSPENPDVMKLNEWVGVSFNYTTNQNEVRIFARPFTNGALTPNYAGQGSPLYPGSSGDGSNGFTVTSGQKVVDQIRITMWNAGQTILLFEAFLPVYYRYLPQPNIVHEIEFRPTIPNAFQYNQNITATFKYSHNQSEGVYIFVRPFSGPNLSPNYAASGSPVYPVGSGSGNGTFRLTAGPGTVDRVRIRMVKLDGTLLYEAFVPVNLQWLGAGPPPGPDMSITAVEVTQAIQDLNNSVDLIAGKKTYVRVHVNSPVNVNEVFATLSGRRGFTTLTPVMNPGNPGGKITVRTAPNRGQINDSFWFELPSSWTSSPGNLTLTARLDPNNAKNDQNLTNNTRIVTVNLLSSQPLRLKLVNIRYTVGSSTYLASNTHLNALESWLRRAYPIPNLQVTRSTFTYPNSGLPNVDTVNSYLGLSYLFGVLFGTLEPSTVFYGIVDDGGGFMRGKASGIPGISAAGPTGADTWGWDTDGSYGDWYGGHEIAHTRGRYHAMFCGAGGGAAYPYPDGRISPSLTGNNAIYGFDIETRAIYGPNWKDVMTYCNNQWISDFTYEGIRSYLLGGSLMAIQDMMTASNFLIVSGTANLDFSTASISDMYLISQEATLPLPDPGDWTIVLLDASHQVLAVYPFEPDELTDAEDSFGRPALINEIVPWAVGAVRVEIRRGEEVLASRNASLNTPIVDLTTPATNSTVEPGPFVVTWTGTDPDGDELTYSLLHSKDGMAWQTLASGITGSSLQLHTDQIPGGSGDLRLIASDGLLTDEDINTNVTFPLHQPSADIILPEPGRVFFPTQQIVLLATGYDLEDGELEDDQFLWESSIDGNLGSGRSLSTTELTTGDHTIRLIAVDSDGMSTTVERVIRVAEEDATVPVTLDSAPFAIGVVASLTSPPIQETLSLRSSSSTEVTWTATESLPWLSIDNLAGETPSDLALTFNPQNLSVGIHSGFVTFTSAQAENSPLQVPVNIQIIGQAIYLPMIRR